MHFIERTNYHESPKMSKECPCYSVILELRVLVEPPNHIIMYSEIVHLHICNMYDGFFVYFVLFGNTENIEYKQQIKMLLD